MIKWQELKHLLLNPNQSEFRLLEKARELGRIFTKDRTEIGKYVLDVDLVSAYTAIYFSTNYSKLEFLFKLLAPDILMDILSRPWIDWGSGPGTFAYARLNYAMGSVWAVDQSTLMRQQADKILNNYFSTERFLLKGDAEFLNSSIPSEAVLFFGNSLNEMKVDDARFLVEKISPKYVMMIEPGTKESFAKICELKNLLGESWKTLFPCMDLNSSCPIQDGDDWCHQIFNLRHDPEIERLCQKLHLDRNRLPVCAQLWIQNDSRREVEVKSMMARVFRVYPERKYGMELDLCFDSGRIQKVEVWSRYYLKADFKELQKNIFTGCRVEVIEKKYESDSLWRVVIAIR